MIDIKSLWRDICSNLSPTGINTISYSVFIEGLVPLCIKDNVLILLAPTSNNKITVNKNYKHHLIASLQELHSTITDIEVIIEEEKSYYAQEIEAYTAQLAPVEVKEKPVSKFVARYTFENFVVGDSNKLAFNAAKTVAQNPGSAEGYLSFNPLFLYGDVGLGKTHLLHAIGNYLNENNPQLKVLYVPAEKLTNEYVESLFHYSSQDNTMNIRAFREKYRSCDVLMIDDVQFLQNKSGSQEILFHIFNDLYQAGKQIILSSDRPPKEIGTLEDRLRNRFEGGLLADISSPNLEMRIAIIRKKMFLEKVAINDDVVYFLAEQCDSNIRELEGNLSKVILYSHLVNKPYPDIETAKEALRHNAPKKSGIDTSDIINAVSSYTRISKSDLIGKKRTKDIAEARMYAIYIIIELLPTIPLVTIGQIFGGRDHTTIIHARDKIASQIKTNDETARAIKDIKGLLNM